MNKQSYHSFTNLRWNAADRLEHSELEWIEMYKKEHRTIWHPDLLSDGFRFKALYASADINLCNCIDLDC